MRQLLLALVLVLLCAAAAAAQGRVRVEGEAEHPAAALLREIVARDRYTLIDRDTLIPADAALAGDLVVVNATVRLEGTLEGSAAVVRGALFLRPGARVAGRLAALEGDVFPSARAVHGDTLVLPLEVDVAVSRAGGAYTVRMTPPRRPGPLAPTGIFGLGLPTYDRVDGATVPVGVSLRLGADSVAPRLTGTARIHVARRALGGELALVLPAGRAAVTLAGGRETATNERWIRGDLANSLAALAVRSDARDYWESDFALLRLARRGALALETGQGALSPRLELRASRDRSLRTRDVWSAVGRGEPWRANPAVREGVLTSLTAGTAAAWRGSTTRFHGDAAVEWGALSEELRGARQDPFVQLVADGRWNMRALATHSAAVRFHLLHPLSGAAPPQRFSSVGGVGTLPTLEFDARRGDHLVYVESSYLIPVTAVTVPVLGAPALALTHAVGSAWRSGEDAPRWEQNLGAGLQFAFAAAHLYVDPAAGRLRPTVSLSLALP